MPITTTPVDYDVYIGSLDMDGCVLNSELRDLIETQASAGKRLYDDKDAYTEALLRTNADLLAHIKANQAAQNYLVCGSARQDFFINALNAQRYFEPNWVTLGSATAILKDLVEALSTDLDVDNFELDKLLLGSIFQNAEDKDAYFDQVDKETEDFLQATDTSVDQLPEHEDRSLDFVFDDSKLLLVYAQMHHAAMQNPGKKIHFEFFDDRQDILDKLYLIFEANPALIPPNLTLTLTKYKDELSIFKELQGAPENVVDNDFATTIKYLASMHYRKAGFIPHRTDRTPEQKNARIMRNHSMLNIANSPAFFRSCMRRIAIHRQEKPVVSHATLVAQFGLAGVGVRGGAGAGAAAPTATEDAEEALRLKMAAIAIAKSIATDADLSRASGR